MNLAGIALKAIVDALAQDEDGARAALAALLSPVVDRDPKPDTTRPAPKRVRTRRTRPAPAAAPDASGTIARSVEPEAAQLVAELVAQAGTMNAASTRWGFAPESLKKWSENGPCSPKALVRLREAAHAPASKGLSFGGPQRRTQEATPAAAPDEAAAGEGAEGTDAA